MSIETSQNYFSQSITYAFRKDKETGTKRDNVVVAAPIPTDSFLAEILTNKDKYSREYDLLVEALTATVRSAGLQIVGDENITSSNFPSEKLQWSAIANQPKEDRRSFSISEEAWASFGQTFLEVMPKVATGKTEVQIANALGIFLKKLAPAKGNKGPLKKLMEFLTVFANTEVAADHAEVLEFLLKRAENYLAADDTAAMLDNL